MARTLRRLPFVWLNRLLQVVWRDSPARWYRDLLLWSAQRAWALGADEREVDDGIPF